MDTDIPKVANLKTDKYTFYIGRAGYGLEESIFHNPFKISDDCTRELSIQLYEKYVRSDEKLMMCIPLLKGQVLGCWCKPLACHGDVLVKLYIEQITKIGIIVHWGLYSVPAYDSVALAKLRKI